MATTRMVFNLVANDSASAAFDKLARNVELSNAAIAKHNLAAGESTKALDSNSGAADRNSSSVSRMTGTLETASKGFGMLATAAVAMAPAAVAGVAVLSAGLIGVSGILVSAGAAMGVFGLTAKSQFTALSAGYKQIETLKQQAALAPAGSKQQAADYAKLALEQQKYTATFGPAAAGMNNMQNAWTQWKQSTSGPTLSILADGMNLVATALPKLKPLFDTGAQAAAAFLNSIKGWVTGGGMDRAVQMLNNLAKAIGPSMQATMKNLASIAGALAPLFYDLAIKVAQGMASITGAMASWMGNKGVDAMNSFMAYIRANGPAVWNLLKTLADAAVNIVKALAPLAPISLAIATALARLVAAAPPGVIQAVAVAFVAYSLGMKAMAIWTPVATGAMWLYNTAVVAADLAMIPLSVTLGIIIGVIALVGAAIYLLIKYHQDVWAFIQVVWHGFLSLVQTVWQGIQSATQSAWGIILTVINAFKSAWDTVSAAAKTAVGVITGAWSAVAGAFTSAWSSVAGFFTGIVNAVIGQFDRLKNWITSSFNTWWASNGEAIKQIWSAVWGTVSMVVQNVWSTISGIVQTGIMVVRTAIQVGMTVVQAVWNAAWLVISTIVQTVWAIISPIIQAGMTIIRTAIQVGMTVVQAVWNAAWLVISTAVKIAWGVVQAILTAGMAVLQAAWNLFWAVLGNTLKVIWAGIQAVIKIAWDVIVGIFTVAINLLTGHWSAAWTALQNMATQVWNAIKAFFQVTWAAIQAIFTAALTFVQNLLSAAWNLIKSVVTTVWNAISSFFTGWWTTLKNNFNLYVTDLKLLLSLVWNTIKNDAISVWNAIKSFFTGWWNTLKADWNAAVEWIKWILAGAWDVISGKAHAVFDTLKGWFNTWWGGIKQGFSDLVSGVKVVWDTVKAVAEAPVKFIVNTVYDKGIVPIVNAVGGLIGLHLNAINFAEGGRVTAGTGPKSDDVLARVSRGETVVSAEHSQVLAPAFSALGVPGYATGGIPFGNIGKAISAFVNPVSITQDPGTLGALTSLTGDALAAAASKILNPLLSAVPTFGVPLGEGIKKIPATIIEKLVALLKATGGGGDIVSDAKSWIGKIPYVWGGTTLGPGGADCSGFTQSIYGRHGISAPRTSEAQGAWVKRGAPAAGGLAFYHSSGGGADPGHVAIVADASNVVSQGGGMGPVMMGLHGMPLLWTGVPPGGFPAGAGGGGGAPGAGGAAAGSVKALAQQMAAARGWTGAQWNALNSVEMAEAGWSLTATNPSSGAYGIAQGITGPSWYAANGGNATTASGQITAFLNYVASRYGTPAAAWAHEQSAGWYARGSWDVPSTGPAVVHQGEMILPAEFAAAVRSAIGAGSGPQPDRIERLLIELIRTTAAVPAATGRHVGGAISGAAGAAGFRSRYPVGGS